MSNFSNDFKNPFENLYEKYKKSRADFNAEIAQKTDKYQQKFGFKKGTDPNRPTQWNNEADAFKHAFMQGVLYHRASKKAYNTTKDSTNISLPQNVQNTLGNMYSAGIGVFHEAENLLSGDSVNESNMDLWNNDVGRETMKEIKNKLGNDIYNFQDEFVENLLANKIYEKMKKGELILTPNDKRQYIMRKVINSNK